MQKRRTSYQGGEQEGSGEGIKRDKMQDQELRNKVLQALRIENKDLRDPFLNTETWRIEDALENAEAILNGRPPGFMADSLDQIALAQQEFASSSVSAVDFYRVANYITKIADPILRKRCSYLWAYGIIPRHYKPYIVFPCYIHKPRQDVIAAKEGALFLATREFVEGTAKTPHAFYQSLFELVLYRSPMLVARALLGADIYRQSLQTGSARDVFAINSLHVVNHIVQSATYYRLFVLENGRENGQLSVLTRVIKQVCANRDSGFTTLGVPIPVTATEGFEAIGSYFFPVHPTWLNPGTGGERAMAGIFVDNVPGRAVKHIAHKFKRGLKFVEDNLEIGVEFFFDYYSTLLKDPCDRPIFYAHVRGRLPRGVLQLRRLAVGVEHDDEVEVSSLSFSLNQSDLKCLIRLPMELQTELFERLATRQKYHFEAQAWYGPDATSEQTYNLFPVSLLSAETGKLYKISEARDIFKAIDSTVLTATKLSLLEHSQTPLPADSENICAFSRLLHDPTSLLRQVQETCSRSMASSALCTVLESVLAPRLGHTLAQMMKYLQGYKSEGDKERAAYFRIARLVQWPSQLALEPFEERKLDYQYEKYAYPLLDPYYQTRSLEFFDSESKQLFADFARFKSPSDLNRSFGRMIGVLLGQSFAKPRTALVEADGMFSAKALTPEEIAQDMNHAIKSSLEELFRTMPPPQVYAHFAEGVREGCIAFANHCF
jgi:hypothetical protein